MILIKFLRGQELVKSIVFYTKSIEKYTIYKKYYLPLNIFFMQYINKIKTFKTYNFNFGTKLVYANFFDKNK